MRMWLIRSSWSYAAQTFLWCIPIRKYQVDWDQAATAPHAVYSKLQSARGLFHKCDPVLVNGLGCKESNTFSSPYILNLLWPTCTGGINAPVSLKLQYTTSNTSVGLPPIWILMLWATSIYKQLRITKLLDDFQIYHTFSETNITVIWVSPGLHIVLYF
jgi:hypothetical protein